MYSTYSHMKYNSRNILNSEGNWYNVKRRAVKYDFFFLRRIGNV